jgi:hypothetical protein
MPAHLFEQQSLLPEHAAPPPAQQVLPVPHVDRSPQLESAAHALLAVHPHAPAVHVGPGPQVEVQLMQLPLVPQASSAVPAAHVPELQQPPLHAVSFVPRHALPHWCVIVLHACPALEPLAAGQSVSALQPHTSDVGSHCAPPAPAEHTAHVPEPPHAPGAVPLTQEPPEQQNPPPHVPLPLAPQAALHVPAAHVGVPLAQTEHVCPFVPQAPAPSPEAHVPELQHPPLHCVWLVPRHELVHVCVFVLQASPAFAPFAAGQSDCEVHPHVSVVSTHSPPAALPVHTAHVPEPPHAPGAVPATHAPAEQQVPPPHVPSPPAPHAAVHVPAVHVGVAPAQTEHAAPALPQAPFCVPATHVPPVPQQPVLHGCVASQVVEQRWVVVLQVSSAGQSLTPLQPHVAPLSQTCPTAESRQSEHVPPVLPHVSFPVPPTHMPVDEQHPPLHPVVPVPQDAEQLWVVVLQAWPDGQSVEAVHPQAPLARHAWPTALPVQLAHTVPSAPHWPTVVPDWQVPEVALEQHPVGHGSVELQTKTQIPAVHDWAPVPQSDSEAQPH